MVIFVLVDLLLGQLLPKVYVPTKYGWTVPSNTKNVGSVEDTKGTKRTVFIQYFEHGFKRWPISTTSKPRVLIVGDSFTEMVYVSNGEEWYSYLERGFPEISFYVFGGGGYGTLQQLMVLKDHINEVRPDSIIWQFCENDYVNNHYILDRRDYPFNNHYIRPYFEDGKTVYRLPLAFSSLRKVSFAADQLLHWYDRYAQKRVTRDRNRVPQRKQTDEKRVEALEVTKDLMRLVRVSVGRIPVFFFNACGEFTDNDKEVCNAGEFNCMEFVGEYLNKYPTGRQVFVENDGHWNFLGNKVVGEAIVAYLKNKKEFSNVNGRIKISQ